MFESERLMVDGLATLVSDGRIPWLQRAIAREFDYQSGWTDLLGVDVDNHIVAFEAKLTDWRKALEQAWRNTSYAERVFVVLPRDRAKSALNHLAEFASLGVGLCLMDGVGLELAFHGCQHDPVLPWVHNKARTTLKEHGRLTRGTRTRNLQSARI